jgi:hypothetical protein
MATKTIIGGLGLTAILLIGIEEHAPPAQAAAGCDSYTPRCGFPGCLTGYNPGRPIEYLIHPCTIYDYDCDEDVDLFDFAEYQVAFTG